MNNSNNRNRAIEYATKLTERAAGLTIMTAIETAWNNLTPANSKTSWTSTGAKITRPSPPPSTAPTPHLTSEDWWDKDYGEENPALQQYLTEIGTNLTRLNANPKQNGNLWDGTDTDSKYAYFPIYDFNRNTPRHRHVSPIRSQQPRGPLTPLGHRQRRERVRRYYSNAGVDETPAHHLHL